MNNENIHKYSDTKIVENDIIMVMKNLTISLDETLISQARKYVEEHGISLNSFIAEILSDAIGASKRQQEATSEILTLASKIKGNSRGKHWSREDLHED